MNEELFTVEEAARILKVRRETIRQYIKNGHLKALILPGGDYRFREKDIQKLLSRPAQKQGVAMESNGRLTMTIPEFAQATGCSKNLAFRLARQNKLPIEVIFIGDKRMCVSRKAVLALLEGNGKAIE